VAQLTDRDLLLRAVDAGVRKKFITRWERVAAGGPLWEEIVFRLSLAGGESLMVRERGVFFLPSDAGGFLVGYWSPVTESSSLIHTENR
jgi:hypothetical protein